MKKKLVLLTLMLGLGSCAISRAQEDHGKSVDVSPIKQYDDSFLASLAYGPNFSMNGEDDASVKKGKEATEVISSLYDQYIGDSAFSSHAQSNMLSYYSKSNYIGSPMDRLNFAVQSQVEYSAFTVAQNQLIIQQNKQIIDLLTKIANKK